MKLIIKTADLALINEVNDFIQEWNTTSTTIITNTSGSTGKPKEVSLSKKHMEASARMTGDFLQLKSGNQALLCLPVGTIAGKMMIVRAIVLDLDLIIVDVDSSPLLHTDLEIDFAAMVPLQAKNSIIKLQSDIALGQTDKQNQVGKLIIGGGTISDELWNSISSSPIRSYQTFGMTETISHVAMREINSENIPYEALPGVELGLKNECLTISASHIGVTNLITNDIIKLIDSKHFEWLGRKDFVINSGGVKIHPEQIEQAINSLIKEPFFSCGLEDTDLGSRHVLCVESSLLINLTKEDFRKFLNKHSIPKEIYYFNSFRYTESGKINRTETLKNILNAKKQIL